MKKYCLSSVLLGVLFVLAGTAVAGVNTAPAHGIDDGIYVHNAALYSENGSAADSSVTSNVDYSPSQQFGDWVAFFNHDVPAVMMKTHGSGKTEIFVSIDRNFNGYLTVSAPTSTYYQRKMSYDFDGMVRIDNICEYSVNFHAMAKGNEVLFMCPNISADFINAAKEGDIMYITFFYRGTNIQTKCSLAGFTKSFEYARLLHAVFFGQP